MEYFAYLGSNLSWDGDMMERISMGVDMMDLKGRACEMSDHISQSLCA